MTLWKKWPKQTPPRARSHYYGKFYSDTFELRSVFALLLIMRISYRIQDRPNLVIPFTKVHKTSKHIGKRRQKRNEECPSVCEPKRVISIEKTSRSSVVLTLSPRARSKLSIKQENVDNIKLYPDNGTKFYLDSDNEKQPVVKTYQPSSPVTVIDADEENQQLMQNLGFLMDEKQTLISMKALLEEKLVQEQKKHDNLKNHNESLKFDVVNATTKTLELSIDKRSLEDEMQRIMWQWNGRFLLPVANRKIYTKL